MAIKALKLCVEANECRHGHEWTWGGGCEKQNCGSNIVELSHVHSPDGLQLYIETVSKQHNHNAARWYSDDI